jgi:ApaG protein
MMANVYSAITHGIEVQVRTYYLEDQSEPDEGHFVWAYKVTVANGSRDTVQLMHRTWLITNARGRVQRVHGPGVLGEQPVLEPGEAFEYTSGTPLDTASGFMAGTYHMVRPASGETFDVDIPAFSLDSPHANTKLH